MDYTAQNLEYAVSVFYNGEQVDRAKAHAWLTAAQRVPEAWNFVWELLQPNKVLPVSFALKKIDELHSSINILCYFMKFLN